MADALSDFLPPVADWFRRSLGEPTAVQAQGWPIIRGGHNCLLLAPTGSGKTLAAFLACLDELWRQPRLPRAVKVLYISPLKALNNDIHRNLQLPLVGVAEAARSADFPLPAIEAAVRTGDTPTAERQKLLRKPPHVLITTPESLHLLLTSRGRDTLRQLSHCIVDEIHALCPNKRGVFLSLLLERLQELNPQGFTRIGLSATQRPLEEVARFLGGLEADGSGQYQPRPVQIVDAGLRKNLDLQVLSPVEQFGPLPEKTIWPYIYRLLDRQIQKHRSTIVFANNRRSVERITNQLNELALASGSQDSGSNTNGNSIAGGDGETNFVQSDLAFAHAHHGSVSLDVRRSTEQALKDGLLRTVVATGSLELGIDMGAVDLVCQVESPGSVARGLQRVGRAGHLVGSQSKGRLIPKTLGDLVEQSVLAAEMMAGRVEELRVPVNCLDVLAQQIIAMTSMEDRDVPELFRLVRQAYPYRNLSAQAFDTVLQMTSGRFAFTVAPEPAADPVEDRRGRAIDPARQMSAFQPRISWDRVHNRLQALPGSQRLALMQGGTIPDTGQYAVMTLQGLRLGELDEEFVYERRVGDTFLLGTNGWRINKIDTDRVLVEPAEGIPAMVPFWRGERVGRSFDLGQAQGRMLRRLADALDDEACLTWLREEHHLDLAAARNLRDHVRRQLRRTDIVPSDRAAIVEASRDELGDWQVLLLTPLGSRFHFTLRLAIENRLHQRLGYRPHCLHHDDGVLIRLADSDEPVLDLLEGITSDRLQELVLTELADSALFALRFRQNAARALLMPRAAAGKRAPLWLQRLRGRDLLQLARRHADFPILVETFRECVEDHLELDHVAHWLDEIASGEINVKTCRLETPSPFASSVLFSFMQNYMYQYDSVDAEPADVYSGLDRGLLEQLIPGKQRVDARAVAHVDSRLRNIGQPPRTPPEMAEWLRKIGDVTPSELEGDMADFLVTLRDEGIAQTIELPEVSETTRHVLTEEAEHYRRVFLTGQEGDVVEKESSAARILHRYLQTHVLVGLDDVLARYPFDPLWARRKLEHWASMGRLVVVTRADAPEPLQWSAPDNYDRLQRTSIAIERREAIACPSAQYVDFVLRWQHLHPDTNGRAAEGLQDVLERLEGWPAAAELWEQTLLPARLRDYQPRALNDTVAAGRWLWWMPVADQADNLAFLQRENLGRCTAPIWQADNANLAERVYEALQSRGALFVTDLGSMLQARPIDIREALWTLVRAGLVTNDHFDAVRQREERQRLLEASADTRGRDAHSVRRPRPGRPTARTMRMPPEGRWSLLPWRHADRAEHVLFQAELLLHRYGVIARELAQLDPALPPWRLLYDVLSRLEMAGDIRRGYFVEGLSGAQFALPEALTELARTAQPSQSAARAVLLHSLDPANLFGSRAPFDIDMSPTADEGDAMPEGAPDAATRTAFVRRAGNWIVVRAGRPVLLIEQHGKKVTSVPAASGDDLKQATACLPALLQGNAACDPRRKLTVETWNGQPVTATPGKLLLEAAGFVRDYQAMTLYAAWR